MPVACTGEQTRPSHPHIGTYTLAALTPPRRAQATLDTFFGNIPFTGVARTYNYDSKVHRDGGDGPISVIGWWEVGEGTLSGGQFVMPGLELCMVPGHMGRRSCLALATPLVSHATAPAVSSGTRRLGSGIYYKFQVAREVKWFEAGAVSFAKGGCKGKGGTAAKLPNKKALRARGKALMPHLMKVVRPAGWRPLSFPYVREA